MSKRYQIYENHGVTDGPVWDVIGVNGQGQCVSTVSAHATMQDAADEANRLNEREK